MKQRTDKRFSFHSGVLMAVPVIALLATLTPNITRAQDDSDLTARVAALEDQVQHLRGGGSAATNLDVRLTTLENAMRDLNGQIERNQFAVTQLQTRLDKMSSDLDVHFDQMQKDIDALKTAQQQLATAAAAAAQPAASSKTTATQTAEAKTDSGTDKTDAAKDGDDTADMTPEQQYDHAFGFLRATKYADAEDAFKNFIADNPKSSLLGNARYWLGETFYAQGKFNEAAVTFAESYEKAPKGVKAPDSLLKLGMSLGALGKKADACVALKEIPDKYPNATPLVRSRATVEMKKLGCQS